MPIHLFCPQCQAYLGQSNTCRCGWMRSKRVTHPDPPRWQVQLPASIVGPILLTPRQESALVGYGSRGGQIGGLACIALDNGAIRWQKDVGASVSGGAAIAHKRIVLFGDMQGRLHGLHLNDGQPAWDYLSLDGPVTTAPIVAEVRAYVGTAQGTLYCLDWRNGHEVWHTTIPRRHRRPRPRIAARPVWARGKVWVGAYDGHIYAIDADRGHWTEVYDAQGKIHTALQVIGKKLIFGTNAGTLHVLSTHTGKEVWTPFQATSGIPAAPYLRDGVIYTSSLDHHLYAVNLSDGQFLWSLDLGHGLATTPAWIQGGWLALGSNRGDIITVDVKCQEVVWRFSVNEEHPTKREDSFPVLGGPIFHNGIVYAGASNGGLYALPWHGGQWEKASEALARLNHVEEAAACLALGAAPNADLRVAQFLTDHDRFHTTARVFEAMERLTDAARSYERAAKLKAGMEAARLWERASELWHQLDESNRAKLAKRKAAQARGDPVLNLMWLGDTSFREGEASQIRLRVTNQTATVARELQVIASGRGFTTVKGNRAELIQGDEWVCRLERLVPECAGTTTLHIEVRCESNERRIIAYRWRFEVQVAGREQPPIVNNVDRQFTGPARVVALEGDAGMVRVDSSGEPSPTSISVNGDVGMVRTTELHQGGKADDKNK